MSPVTSLVVCRDADESALPTEADIEDLFAVGDYLRLYNWTFDASVSETELPDNSGRILKRLESVAGPFDHARPAHTLTDRRDEFFQGVDAQSVDRFKHLFEMLNSTLESD